MSKKELIVRENAGFYVGTAYGTASAMYAADFLVDSENQDDIHGVTLVCPACSAQFNVLGLITVTGERKPEHANEGDWPQHKFTVHSPFECDVCGMRYVMHNGEMLPVDAKTQPISRALLHTPHVGPDFVDYFTRGGSASADAEELLRLERLRDILKAGKD